MKRKDPKDVGPNRNVAPNGGGRYGKAVTGGIGDAASWGDVPGDTIARCIQSVTAVGDALLFSVSGDGGVLTLQLLSGADRHKWYFRDADAMTAKLELLAQLAEETPPD